LGFPIPEGLFLYVLRVCVLIFPLGIRSAPFFYPISPYLSAMSELGVRIMPISTSPEFDACLFEGLDFRLLARLEAAPGPAWRLDRPRLRRDRDTTAVRFWFFDFPCNFLTSPLCCSGRPMVTSV